MTPFHLRLCSTDGEASVPGVTAFVAADASGSFALWPGHTRFMTVLAPGLARFRCGEQPWQHAALAGGLLDCDGEALVVTTRLYVLGEDPDRLATDLRDRLARETATLRATREGLRRLEDTLMQRLRDSREAEQ